MPEEIYIILSKDQGRDDRWDYLYDAFTTRKDADEEVERLTRKLIQDVYSNPEKAMQRFNDIKDDNYIILKTNLI